MLVPNMIAMKARTSGLNITGFKLSFEERLEIQICTCKYLTQETAFREPDGRYFMLHIAHGLVFVQKSAALQEPVDLYCVH
jgi:hypothetical protein